MRALVVIRLSRLTDATTSPERQREVCERLCADRGWSVVGVAEDLDISAGSVRPSDRPSLRPWFTERAHEYDVLVTYRLDRLVRRVAHLSRVIEWADENNVQLVSATERDFDLTTASGRMFANLIASFAEMELEAISERNSNAAQHNIRAGKYRGGTAPAGYRARRDNNGEWRLVLDEVMAPVVREIVFRVLTGERLSTIVRDLNAREVQTTKDRQAELNGREAEGRRWTVSNLRRMLSTPTLIGQVVHRPVETDANGKPRKDKKGKKLYGPEQVLFGDDGSPLVRAEPLISEADYRKLQRLLAERAEETKHTKRAPDTMLLIRVLHCGQCQRPMYRLKGGPGRKPRYRCSSTQYGGSCGSGSIPIVDADEIVTERLLETLGDVPFAEKKFDPGSDHADELADIDARLETLAEAVSRFPTGSPALDVLLAQVDTLSGRRETLVNLPSREAGYRYVETGESFSERWEAMSSAARNDYLRANGVYATFRLIDRAPVWHVDFGDLLAMVRAVNPERAYALQAELGC